MRGALLAAVSLTALASAGPAHAVSLNLLIWEAYIDGSILKDFTARTGIEVHQTYYDSGDARDSVGSAAGSVPGGNATSPCPSPRTPAS